MFPNRDCTNFDPLISFNSSFDVDVYKRQVIHIASVFQNCRDIRSHISFTIRNADDHRAILTRHPDPVSYTHLDVYKRQLRDIMAFLVLEVLSGLEIDGVSQILSLIHIYEWSGCHVLSSGIPVRF